MQAGLRFVDVVYTCVSHSFRDVGIEIRLPSPKESIYWFWAQNQIAIVMPLKLMKLSSCFQIWLHSEIASPWTGFDQQKPSELSALYILERFIPQTETKLIYHRYQFSSNCWLFADLSTESGKLTVRNFLHGILSQETHRKELCPWTRPSPALWCHWLVLVPGCGCSMEISFAPLGVCAISKPIKKNNYII